MAITKAQVRKRLHSAKSAAVSLREDVEWLVRERAWVTLGYRDFSEMWRLENGDDPTTFVQVLAVKVLHSEGMNTRTGTASRTPDGHTKSDVAEMIGIGGRTVASGVIAQIESGIPEDKITKSRSVGYGGRLRAKPVRQGKLPNELISVGWSVFKYQADAVKEVARKAGVPDSVVVRSALDAYLQGKVGKAS